MTDADYQITRGHVVTKESTNLLWVYDLHGKDTPLIMFDGEPPQVLPGHAVTVIRYNGMVVAVGNHTTGQSIVYRRYQPTGPYYAAGSGCMSLLFLVGLFASFALMAAGGLPGVIIGFLVASVCYNSIRAIMKDNADVERHNLQVDEDLQRLLVPDPAQIKGETQGR
jgi:hypothetical protein